MAIGFPLSGVLSEEPIVTTGIVSALAGIRGDPTQLQISAPVQPGNSGGPVFDMNGNLVRIVVAGIGTLKAARAIGGAVPQNVNFAVNVAEAQKFLNRHKVAWQKRLRQGPAPVGRRHSRGGAPDHRLHRVPREAEWRR